MKSKKQIEEALNKKPFVSFLKDIGLDQSNGQIYKAAKSVLKWVLSDLDKFK